ncbi:MAG: competence/damage-inducible protein A [Formosa sp.]|jgi:nicotinamide-nucleotide amidase|nr:competence/damage-inducible protein A [Formosa sp.]MDG1375050.1 competence/damage-inducible protein A [Flavobacteriaceae bacterium]
MKAEIITIGDEILIGQIVDTNSAFIAKELNNIGVSVYQITSVQDDKTHILEAFEAAESNVDIVIITGGLGPTKDDITKKTLAQYFEDVLVYDKAVLDNIKHLWKHFVKQPLLQANIDQSLVLSKATALMNKSGSAPGMWIEKNNTIFISLPGVPYEMKALMNDEVLPRISEKFKRPYILHKTLLTYGLGESVIAERIKEWESALPDSIKLAYLPNLGRVRLRLSSKGFDKAVIVNGVDSQIELLLPLINDIFVGFEEQSSIEQIIGNQLVKLGKTLSVAESCTGGKIAENITAYDGASAYFKGGIVAYATETKIDILKVDPKLISQHSVVSSEVAEAMAQNVRKVFNSDYGIATTGNAGPSKGDSDAEIGTVCIAIATPNGVFSQEFNFGKQRLRVVQKAVTMAFTLFQKEIFKKC